MFGTAPSHTEGLGGSGIGFRSRSGARYICWRPVGALLDPAAKDVDFARLQFPVGRHFEAVAVGNGFEQEALVGFTGNDGRAGISTGEESLATADTEVSAGILGFGAMALETVFGQEGPDLFFEELGGRLGWERAGGCEEEEDGHRRRAVPENCGRRVPTAMRGP